MFQFSPLDATGGSHPVKSQESGTKTENSTVTGCNPPVAAKIGRICRCCFARHTDPAAKINALAYQKRSFLSWVHAASPDTAFENSALSVTNTFADGGDLLPPFF